jgi:hypothetical protein
VGLDITWFGVFGGITITLYSRYKIFNSMNFNRVRDDVST